MQKGPLPSRPHHQSPIQPTSHRTPHKAHISQRGSTRARRVLARMPSEQVDRRRSRRIILLSFLQSLAIAEITRPLSAVRRATAPASLRADIMVWLLRCKPKGGYRTRQAGWTELEPLYDSLSLAGTLIFSRFPEFFLKLFLSSCVGRNTWSQVWCSPPARIPRSPTY